MVREEMLGPSQGITLTDAWLALYRARRLESTLDDDVRAPGELHARVCAGRSTASDRGSPGVRAWPPAGAASR